MLFNFYKNFKKQIKTTQIKKEIQKDRVNA